MVLFKSRDIYTYIVGVSCVRVCVVYMVKLNYNLNPLLCCTHRVIAGPFCGPVVLLYT